MTEITQRRYRLLGINDDETTCAVCGRVELKRVMWLQELGPEGDAIGEAFWCGTTCGAKLLKGRYTAAKLATVAKNYEVTVYAKRQAIRLNHPSYQRATHLLGELNRLEERAAPHGRWPFEVRRNHPLFLEMVRLDAEAQKASDEAEIVIEL